MLNDRRIMELFDLANVEQDRRPALMKDITKWARILEPATYQSLEIILHNRGGGVWLFSNNRLMSVFEVETSKSPCAHLIPLCSFRRCRVRTLGFGVDDAGNLESDSLIEIKLEFQGFNVEMSAARSYAGTALAVIARNVMPFMNIRED